MLLALALLSIVVWGALWWPVTIDDAFITFRYAQNLAAGEGPVFNLGERVEGYSCPAWMLGLGFAAWVGLDLLWTSKALGLLCTASLPLLLFLVLRGRCRLPLLPACAALWLALVTDLHLYSTSGMETAQAAAANALCLWLLSRQKQGRRAALLILGALILVLLSRPEGLLLAPALMGAALLTTKDRRARWILLSLLPVLLFLLLARYLYFGAWLPNTYLAKPSPLFFALGQGRWSDGGIQLIDRWFAFPGGPLGLLLGLSGVLLVPLYAVGVWQNRRSSLVHGCLAFALVGAVYLSYCPADWMPGYRFLLPFLVPALVPCVLGLDHVLGQGLWATRKYLWSIPALLLVLGSLAQVAQTARWRVRFHQDRVNPALDARAYATIGRWLQEHADPQDTVLAYEIGALGYCSGLRILDHEGLINRDVARMMKRVGGSMGVRFGSSGMQATMRAVARYCVEQEPQWFLTRSHSPHEFIVGDPVPRGSGSESIQNVLLNRLGPHMVLAKRFPLGPEGRDCYLLLRRKTPME